MMAASVICAGFVPNGLVYLCYRCTLGLYEGRFYCRADGRHYDKTGICWESG